MPLTPFHLGPSSFLGLLLFKIFDFFTFLISSVIIDIEPFLVIILNLKYPLHGFFHTFLGGSILGVFTSIFIYLLKNRIKNLTRYLKIYQNSSFSKILGTSLFGVSFHIVLDSFLYEDIKPFYPLKINPLYKLFTTETIYLFCSISFLIGLLFYLIKLILKCRNN